MTCEHCANAVTSELGRLAGVSAVTVDLAPGGISVVTVTSAEPLANDAVSAALDEAGDYHIGSLTFSRRVVRRQAGDGPEPTRPGGRLRALNQPVTPG
jgi:copper chaperone